jgi:hypothetical protein
MSEIYGKLCVYSYMYTYIYISKYVYIHTNTHVYIYIHIHIYTYILSIHIYIYKQGVSTQDTVTFTVTNLPFSDSVNDIDGISCVSVQIHPQKPGIYRIIY